MPPRLYFFGPIPGATAVLTKHNKDMPALVTSSDEDKACNTGITNIPSDDGYVIVDVDGIIVPLSDGDKSKDCYFSGDGGTTARAIEDIVPGDLLYWMGSIAGYELDTSDRISFNYDIY